MRKSWNSTYRLEAFCLTSNRLRADESAKLYHKTLLNILDLFSKENKLVQYSAFQ